MTGHRFSVLIFVAAVVTAVSAYFLSLPEASSTADRLSRRRDALITQYLMYKTAELQDFKTLKPVLESALERSEYDPQIAVPVGFIYFHEGRQEEALQVLSKMERHPRGELLRFVMLARPDPPDNWDSVSVKDWIDAQLALGAYEILNKERESAEMLVQIRHHENQARGYTQIQWLIEVFAVFGWGLLLSMYFSQRYLKLEGKEFFKLKPLYLPVEHLFPFYGWYLLAYLAISFAAEFALPGQPGILRRIVSYLPAMAIGLILAKRIFFHSSRFPMMDSLGLGNLQMKWMNLFQILGGLAVLYASYTASILIERIWPFPNVIDNTQNRAIIEDPIMGSVLIVFLCVVVPCFEEILFRGLIFRLLLGNTKPWIAILTSSLLFMLMHPLPAWPQIFAIGCGLAIIYYRSANLLISIWVHALWNFTALLMVMFGIM